MDHRGAESRSDDQNETEDSHWEVVESLARVLARLSLRAVRRRSGGDQQTGQAVTSEHRDAKKNSDHGQW
jgi:hypothetical protein